MGIGDKGFGSYLDYRSVFFLDILAVVAGFYWVYLMLGEESSSSYEGIYAFLRVLFPLVSW